MTRAQLKGWPNKKITRLSYTSVGAFVGSKLAKKAQEVGYPFEPGSTLVTLTDPMLHGHQRRAFEAGLGGRLVYQVDGKARAEAIRAGGLKPPDRVDMREPELAQVFQDLALVLGEELGVRIEVLGLYHSVLAGSFLVDVPDEWIGQCTDDLGRVDDAALFEKTLPRVWAEHKRRQR